MVNAPQIQCFVVVAGAETDRMAASNNPRPTTPRFRPSDLLPWADPHIRSLVEQLQDEIREEATQRREAEATDPWSDELDLDVRFEMPMGPRF